MSSEDLQTVFDTLCIPHTPAGEKLRALGSEIRFGKGQAIPLFQDDAPLLYLLIEGCVCCEAETPDGRSVLECIAFRPGDAVNPVGMFTGTLGGERCSCMLDSCFAVLPLDAVLELVQQDGELMNIYTNMLKQALREQTRHKYMLSLRGEERFAWFYENYAEIADIIPSRRVAQFLNLDPATLSRIRKKAMQ